jgi:RNA polymerase sigma factor (sigma-70 family)
MIPIDPLANPQLLIRRVYSFVAYRIGDGPDAEDVTSATFERALRYRSTFDPRRGEPLGWLIGIARREIASYFARRRAYGAGDFESWDPHDLADDEESDLEPMDPRDLADDTALRLYLTAALRTLEDPERELIALRYGGDLTARQIGEVLGRRANAVEVALHRTLGKLRQELEAPLVPEVSGIPVKAAR